MTTLRQALTIGAQRLRQHSDTPRLDAEWLLSAVTGRDAVYFAIYPEHELTPSQAEQYDNYLGRRAQGEPVAYIIGQVGFYDGTFKVSPAVLIPRPETEMLVEQALTWAKAQAGALIAVDVGTGSGAIAITVARHAPNVTMHATDISADALAIARENATAQGANVRFYQGDLLQPLIEAGVKVHLLMANLPYIPHGQLPALAVSAYEPLLALDGGADGLDLIRRLLAQAPRVCHHGAYVLLEIDPSQDAEMLKLINDIKGEQVAIIHDYAGFARFVCYNHQASDDAL